MDCIGEDNTRKAAEVEDSLSMANHMKSGMGNSSDKSSASIELLSDVVILW